MNIKNTILGVFAVTTLWASGAVAAPAVNVGDNSVTSGTPTAAISVNWDGDGTVQSAQFRIIYDSAQLTPVNVAASCAAPWFCSNNNPGTIQFVADQGSPLPDVLVANITFDTSAAAIGNYPLVVTDQLFANSVPAPVAPSGTTNGNLEVSAGPQPAFSSNPTPAAGVTVPSVIQNATATTADVVISNSGDATSTLTGSCSLSSNPDSIFSLSGDTNFSVLQGTTDTVTVTCDPTGSIDNYDGQMTCTHDGASGLSSPQVYALSCAITEGPQPQFSASPNSLVFNAFEQGASIPSQNFTISNTGDSGTTLSSTGAGCSITGVDAAQFLIAGGGTFSVPFGGNAVKAVSCDTSTEGSYSAQIDCTHNGGNNPSINAVSLSCEVGPPGAAIYESTPAPGFAFEFADAISPVDPPTLNMNIRNAAEAGNNELFVNCQFDGSSSPEITYTPTYAGVPFASGGGNANITLACDAENIGNYSATLVCDYGVDGSSTTGGPGSGTASYTLSCDVRGPATQVVPTVPDGTTQTVAVTIGGTGSFSVGFAENLGDDPAPDPYDAFIQGCEINGTDAGIFSITSPNSFPVEIPTDSTVNVTVEGTDDQSRESYLASLDCVYADTSDFCRITMDATTGMDVCGRSVSYPIVLNVGGGDARFTVLKDFTDGNPGEVTVDLDCDSGLILDQEKTITEDGIGVTFVVTEFDSGELNCNVTERPLAGYSTEYNSAGSDSSSKDSGDLVDGCFYTLIDGGDENSCVITNSPDSVNVVITKEWLYPGSADASVVSDYFALEMQCYNAVIEGGYKCGNFSAADGASSESYSDFYTCKNLSGYGNKVFTVEVTPSVYPGGSCYVLENYTDAAVEVDNGCAGSGQGLYVLDVSVGSGDRCTITNTVFFEGIPTLNQYGMALMALLMLGMGFVAVRRVI